MGFGAEYQMCLSTFYVGRLVFNPLPCYPSYKGFARYYLHLPLSAHSLGVSLPAASGEFAHLRIAGEVS